jgi:hypothetical protein
VLESLDLALEHPHVELRDIKLLLQILIDGNHLLLVRGRVRAQSSRGLHQVRLAVASPVCFTLVVRILIEGGVPSMV